MPECKGGSMDAQELHERLTKVLDSLNPGNCMGTMPEDLTEAFDAFVMNYSKEEAPMVMATMLVIQSIEPILSAAFVHGFWLGHDYALEYGQLRGN